ncbi:MAG: hypothetical protein K0Q57_350, partial [Gammaproteobacteria bacterium]|nr:hypothetical protein [Gammaproteobacteria bacterium]
MKIRIIIKYICIALLLCLFHTGFAESLTTAKPEAFELNPIDIGIKISHGQDIIAADDFYPALLNQQEQPYLNISSLFEQLFAYTVNCNDTNHCEVISKPADWNIVFSLKDQNVAVNNKGKVAVYHFDKDSLVEYKHQLWLRYDQMDKILPMNSRWDIRGYQLNINTDLPVLAMMIEKRKSQNQKILAQQKQRQQEQEQLSKLSPLTPSHAVDGALFYQLNDNEAVSGSNTSSRQAQFSGVADIFQGTLAGSGSISQPRTGPIPYTWNYTISKPPYFRTAQIGDTNTNNTAFLGSYQLTNGIKFDKMQGQTASLQFVYYGQTLPGTEVDVWRNGTYLVGIYFADNSGQFTVTDNQASPGDIYTLNYYYTDGKSKVDYVRFASDKGNLLKQGDVDVDVNYGRLDQGDQYMGHAGQSLIRYGVAPGVTMGWGTYYLNFGNDFYNSNSSQLTNQSYLIHYADLAWQAFDSLNLQIDKMLNTSGYAVHA